MDTMLPDVMKVIERALDETGEFLRAEFAAGVEVTYKGDIDLVTRADVGSERIIKEGIAAAFADHAILAEESGRAPGREDAEYLWVVDPVDGTTNFAHGFPMFSVSIALMRGDETIAAGVENPYYRERFLAEKGSGATLNGARLQVSAAPSLRESLVVTGFPYDRATRVDHYLAIWREFMPRVHGILRLGSAALDMCSVAAGRLEVFWEENLRPWDTAAGMLLVTEAGGRVTQFDGSAYSPFDTNLLVTNGYVHDECVGLLREFAPARAQGGAA